MWHNVRAAVLNATFQLLVIYRLGINIHFDIYIYIYILLIIFRRDILILIDYRFQELLNAEFKLLKNGHVLLFSKIVVYC